MSSSIERLIVQGVFCNIVGLLYNLCVFGVWRSLAARFVRVEEVAGSSPATPTGKIGPAGVHTRGAF